MSNVSNFSEMTIPQLQDLLQRQEKLLSNKSFVEKLPDKGQKIKLYHGKILKELNERNTIDQSCFMLSSLSLEGRTRFQKAEVDSIEWKNGKIDPEGEDHYLDSDDYEDEEQNPLAILANVAETKKKIVTVVKEEKLITDEDLKEINELRESGTGSILDGHTSYICKMREKANASQKSSFKPFKTLKTDINDPSKEALFKRGKHWEVTAATPPPSIHGPVKEISIQKSLQLHMEQTEKLKEIQLKNATEKLMTKFAKNTEELMIADTKYRDNLEIESESEDSDKEIYFEVHDEEPKDGGVVFTVYN